MHINILMLCS